MHQMREAEQRRGDRDPFVSAAAPVGVDGSVEPRGVEENADHRRDAKHGDAHEAYQALIQMEQRRSPRRIKVVRAPDRAGHAGTMHVELRGLSEPIRWRPSVCPAERSRLTSGQFIKPSAELHTLINATRYSGK